MPPSLTIGEITSRLGGRLVGSDGLIERVASLEEAGPTEITFFRDAKYRPHLAGCRAGAILLATEEPGLSASQIVLPDPYASYAKVAEWLHPEPKVVPGIHPTAVVDYAAAVHPSAEIGPGAVIGEGVAIGPECVIGPLTVILGPTSLGRGCRIAPRVTIHGGCTLGERVRLLSGVVIGSEGFGYAPSKEGYIRIPQLGGVILGDDVEIGANSCVDRGALHDTEIARGTKIDNLVHIAHNVKIGEDGCIVAQVGISGSTELGRRVTIGGQVGIVGHIRIGDKVMIGAQSGVAKSIPDGEFWSGSPARPFMQLRRQEAFLLALPKRLIELEEQIARMIKKLNAAETGDEGRGTGDEKH